MYVGPVPPNNPIMMELEEEMRKQKDREDGKPEPKTDVFWLGYVIFAAVFVSFVISIQGH